MTNTLGSHSCKIGLCLLFVCLLAACGDRPVNAETPDGEPTPQVDKGFADTQMDFYDDWDTNLSGRLEEPEITVGTFRMFDEDENMLLSEAEWELFAAIFARAEPGDFSSWDADQSGTLTPDEYQAGFNSTPIFATWDADGNELVEVGEFDIWDF